MATAATTGLRFCLLGPLEVRRDGEPLALGGERQRGLLALLLLHANELVTTEHLAEQLFGAEVSDASVRAVRVAVSRLRRLLDDETLETGPGGYLVRAEPAQLDVAEFEALVSEGRMALDRGDPGTAAASFRSALALFRGPPLADLAPLDFVQPEIRRLEEMQLSALMDRIDADLARGAGGELVPELEGLVQANPFQERLRGQLMLALYRSGRQTEALEVYRHTRELLADELGLEPSRALQQLERAMLQHDPGLDETPPAEAATCPFKGLAAFEAADAFYFCGRERLLDEIATRLASNSFLGIVGPSGVGKSSLLRAGVLPALAAGALPGSAAWPVVLVRGGERATITVREAVDACRPGERVVIAVDQLEEIFADDVPTEERAAFLDELDRAAADPAVRALVLVAVRADFYGRFADHARMADRLSRSHVFVRSLDRDELARAIEVPASRAGLEAERPLVDALVAETAGVTGALPLLQTTLLQLWRARDGRVLRYDSYRALGGLRGGVARLAEETYRKLQPDERALTRRIMLRLAGGDEGALVRRRVPLADLRRLDGAGHVVDALVAARLLTVDDELVELSHEALLHEWPRYAEWLEEDRVDRLVRTHLTASAAEWDSRGRDTADLYRGARLTAALELPSVELSDPEREFLDAGRAEAERELDEQRSRNRRLRVLLVGAGVLLAAAVVAGVVAFQKSRTASHDARVELAAQLGDEALVEPRIDRAMLLARESLDLNDSPQTEGTLLATLLRTPAVVATFTVPVTARPCCALSVSPDGSILGIPDDTVHLRLVDVHTHKTLHVFSPAGFLSPPAFTPDGSTLAFPALHGPHTGVVDLADAHTLAVHTRLPFDPRWQKHPITGPSRSLFFTPDGRTLLCLYQLVPPAGTRAYVDRWDVASGKRTSASVGADGALAGALVDHGREFAVVGNSEVTFLDTKTLRPRRRVSYARPGGPQATLGENAITVSPDGTTLVVGSQDGTITFIDLRTGRNALGQGGHSAPVDTVAYSPAGTRLVSTAADGSLIVWDPRTRTPVERLDGNDARVTGVAFSSNDQTLFTSSLDGAIFEWDLGASKRFGSPFAAGLHDPRPVLEAFQQTPPLAISPEGTRFAVRSGPSTVAVYSTRTLRPVATFDAGVGLFEGLAWSPAGPVAVTGGSGRVSLWDLNGKPRQLRSLHGLGPVRRPEVVDAAAFSPDGRLLAAGDFVGTNSPGYGTVAVWDTATGKLLWKLPRKVGAVNSVAFSPDGKLLAVAHGTITLYDPVTGRRVTTIHRKSSFTPLTVAFTPNGTLATGDTRGIVSFWNPKTGRSVGHRVLVAASPVGSLSFAPTGTTFATTGGADGLKLWTTATEQQFGSAFPGPRGRWGHAQYAPDGSHLIVVYQDGEGFVWPTSVRSWEQHACAVAGRNFTREEWARYVPGHSYARVCR